MRQRVDDLPDAGDAGSATDEAEGDIGAERRCRAQVREARPAEHRSGVGRPPAEAGASRNLLVERDRRRAPGEGERPSHQVVLVWTDRLGTVRSHNRERVTRRNLKSVVKIKRHHLGIDQVIAIVAPAGDSQRKGQLGRGDERLWRNVGISRWRVHERRLRSPDGTRDAPVRRWPL